MKTNLIGIVLAASVLTSFAAFADAHAVRPVHGPAPAARPGGRYELQTTQQWVPARYEQVTVQQCRPGVHHRHWQAQRCFPVTQTRLIPGHYRDVQQWVWVQHRGHRPALAFHFGLH